MGKAVLRVCEAPGGLEYRANFHFSNNSCFSSCLNKLMYFVLACTLNFPTSIFCDAPFLKENFNSSVFVDVEVFFFVCRIRRPTKEVVLRAKTVNVPINIYRF
jgi:hypothetical protein